MVLESIAAYGPLGMLLESIAAYGNLHFAGGKVIMDSHTCSCVLQYFLPWASM